MELDSRNFEALGSISACRNIILKGGQNILPLGSRQTSAIGTGPCWGGKMYGTIRSPSVMSGPLLVGNSFSSMTSSERVLLSVQIRNQGKKLISSQQENAPT